MIAVIFEMWPKNERRNEFLDIAGQLKSALGQVQLGSLSLWRDEQTACGTKPRS